MVFKQERGQLELRAGSSFGILWIIMVVYFSITI